MARKRVDVLLVERGLCPSREKAQAHLLAGEVWSGNDRLTKAGQSIPEDTPLEVRPNRPAFVGRAGEKMAFALERFGVDPSGRVAIDVGASTGGFTDCLLQRGARHVIAVDVGYGQLDSKLRNDPRVTVMERTNARHLTLESLTAATPIASELSLGVMDVSFISVEKVLVPLARALPSILDWVVLFKPQFEVGPENLGKGGVVRVQEAVTRAVEALHTVLAAEGLLCRGGPESSPLPGKKSGNVELLIHYARTT